MSPIVRRCQAYEPCRAGRVKSSSGFLPLHLHSTKSFSAPPRLDRHVDCLARTGSSLADGDINEILSIPPNYIKS